MQIHELNTFSGTPGDTDFLAIDAGFDTGKISATNLLAEVNGGIDKLKSDKVNLPLDGNNQPTDGTPGQGLRTKGDGSTEWADIGLPTDAQTAQAVSDWLDAHPEATTTVQDGSITEAKLSSALQLKTIKDYVTPQMYGAVGDGVTDDTAAFISALSSGKAVIVPTGSYLITEKLTIPQGCTFNGMGSDTVLIRETSNSDYTDFLLVGGFCDVGNFNIQIKQGAGAPVFNGAFIKMNEVSLASWVTSSGNIRTIIHDIYALCNMALGSNNEVAALRLSLENTFAGGRDGFSGLRVERYNVACKAGSMLDYYCHVYSNNANYWITGIVFHECFISNTRWGFFPIHSAQNIFDASFYSAQFNCYCSGVQMQAQTGTKGFAYLPKSSLKVTMSFSNCKAWDFVSYGTRPWYFDYTRITNRENIEQSSITTDNQHRGTDFYGIKSDNSLETIQEYNLGLLYQSVCANTAASARMYSKMLGVPNGTVAVRLIRIKAGTSGRFTTFFRYYALGAGDVWGTVSINWVVGNNPVLTVDTGTKGFRFGYVLTQDGNTNTLDLYMYKTGGMYYVCFEALPFDNSIWGVDNSGALSTNLKTLDFYKYPTSEVLLTAVPNDLVVLSPAASKPLVLSGTDQWGNAALFLLQISNGTLSIVARNYYDF